MLKGSGGFQTQTSSISFSFASFFFGYDRCLKEVVGMAEVSCGSRRSKWVMAWVTEIGDRSGLKWVFGCDRCFWLWFLVVVVVFGCFWRGSGVFGCGCGFCA